MSKQVYTYNIPGACGTVRAMRVSSTDKPRQWVVSALDQYGRERDYHQYFDSKEKALNHAGRMVKSFADHNAPPEVAKDRHYRPLPTDPA